MIHLPKLPLEAKRWAKLARYGTPYDDPTELIKMLWDSPQLAESDRGTWGALYRCIQYEGSVAPITYAVLPHVIEIAIAHREAAGFGFWIDIGHVVEGTLRDPHGIPDGLEEGFDAALTTAVTQSLQHLAQVTLAPAHASSLVLSAFAFSRHPAAHLLRDFLTPDAGFFALCRCPQCKKTLEIWTLSSGIAISPPLPVQPDPEQPQPQALDPQSSAVQSLSATSSSPWTEMAELLEQPPKELRTLPQNERIPENALQLLADHFETAALTARAGVPPKAPLRAVMSLLASLVALNGAVDWALSLRTLAGHVRCRECLQVFEFVKGLPCFTGELDSRS